MKHRSSQTRLRLAVLDMIGTTVHAGDEVPSSFREAFREFGVELSDDSIAQIRGRSKYEAISTLVERLLPIAEDRDAMTRAVYSSFQRRLRESYASETAPVPGAPSVLEWFKTERVQVVLTTGLDRLTADQLVMTLGWSLSALSGVVSGDDVQHGRPAPDLIHAAMRLAGESDPKSVLAAGDTVSDLRAASAAGVGWSIGVTGGAHTREQLLEQPHSVILASIAELPGWLRDAGVVPWREA